MSDIDQFPRDGEHWRHYKSTLYLIIGLGHDTKTGDAVVIYESADTPENQHIEQGMWVRSLSEFLGFTEDHKRRFVYEKETS